MYTERATKVRQVFSAPMPYSFQPMPRRLPVYPSCSYRRPGRTQRGLFLFDRPVVSRWLALCWHNEDLSRDRAFCNSLQVEVQFPAPRLATMISLTAFLNCRWLPAGCMRPRLIKIILARVWWSG